MKKTSVLWWLLRTIVSLSPEYIIGLLLKTLSHSGLMIFSIMILRNLLDELFGAQRFNLIFIWCLIIVLTNAFSALLSNIAEKYIEKKSIYVDEQIQCILAKKVMDDPYPYLESASYLNLKEQALFVVENQNAVATSLHELDQFFRNVVTLLGMAVVLSTLHLFIMAIFICLVGINIGLYIHFLKKQIDFMQGIIPLNRKYGYYAGCCSDILLQKDIRIYRMQELLENKVNEYNKAIKNSFYKFYKNQGHFLGCQNILVSMQSFLAYAYTGLRVFSNLMGPPISIGSFTLYISSILQFTKSSTELGNSIVEMMQLLEYLKPFAQFMSITTQAKSVGHVAMAQKIISIRFEHVCFRYPNQKKDALHNLCFEIKGGEKISIVGLNGAGKTTLVKLLCRLYQPTDGTIYINDKDIWEYEYDQYINEIACVFQDYSLFAFSIEENISCGLPCVDDDGIKEILVKLELQETIEKLPNGLKTKLGKEYFEDGTSLSGGEQQKLAIARALYKKAKLIILDEPASSLDPLAEAKLYDQFSQLTHGQTAIYVSHRMTSSMFCDRILVLNSGIVEDFDTHHHLIIKSGTYQKLFQIQANYYQR